MGETSSIMISMDTDTVPAKKEIAALERQIKKLENKRLPLIGEFEQLQQKVAQAKKAITDADKALAAGKIDKVDHFQITTEASQSIETYSAKIEELRNKIEALDTPILEMQKRMESLKFTGSPDNSMADVGVQAKANLEQAAQAAGRMSSQLGQAKAQSDNLGKSVGKVDSEAGKSASGIKSRMGSALKSVESSVGSFGKRIANTFKSAFVFSVLYKGLSELKTRLSAMLSTNQQFTSSLNQVKSNLAVAFQPIYQAAMPAINALMQLLVKATAYIAAFVNALFGTSLSSSVSAAREMENSIQAVQSGANGATAAEKALTAAIKEKQNQVKALQRENKALQREYEQQRKAVEAQTDALENQISALEREIDTIQKAEDAANKAAQAQRDMIQANIEMLQDKQESLRKASESAQKAIDSQIKALQAQQKHLQDEYDDETKAIDKQIKALQNEIKVIQKAQKAAQEAAKANEKFTADFDELSTLGSLEEADPYDAEIEKIQEKIDALQEEKEVMAEVYEEQRDAIQDSIDALQEEKAAVSERYEAQSEKIQEQIDMLQKAQNAIKDADFSSSIAAYESKIAAIREKIDELNNSLQENPQIEQNELLIEKLQEEIDLLQEQKDAIDASSDAAGNFDSSALSRFKDIIEDVNKKIKDSPLYQWLSDNQEEIEQFMIILGGLIAIIIGTKGIVWAFQHFGDILSWFRSSGGPLMLLLGGLALLITAGGNAQEVIDNVKEAFRLFGEAITMWLDGDFEGAKKKFAEGFTAIANAGIAAWESIVRALQKALRWILEKISAFEKSVPEDSVWHNFFGADWALENWSSVNEEYHMERFPVPALAQGAILPPNKPFYAMLGDQKNGTNLEAPASLIEEIMRNVLAEQQYNFNISADGSLGALIRLLKLHITRETTRETAF